MRVSLVIPAYNEEKRLEPFLASILRYYPHHQSDIHEIIVVDDGSTDQTSAVANTFNHRLPIRVLRLEPNQGKGAAVAAGVQASHGEAIVFMDADGATDISELPKIIAALGTNDVAVGNRWMKGAHTERRSLLRRFAGWVYRLYLAPFHLSGIDTMCGCKGYRREIAHALFGSLQEKRWLFDSEVAYKAILRGYRIANVPIRWEAKDGSKLSLKTFIGSAFHVWPLLLRIRSAERS